MLTTLREKLSGWVAKVIFGLLIFVFSFFGIESYFMARTASYVAKVGKSEISQQQLQDALNRARQQMAQSGQKLDPTVLESTAFKLQVLDTLIDRDLLQQAGSQLGVMISDAQLRQTIAALPYFQVDGHFDPATYQATLGGMGMTAEAFQDSVRSDLAVQFLPQAISASAIATPADLDNFIRIAMQTRDFRYALLPTPGPTDANVSVADIKSYYVAHSAAFMTPEQIAVHYIEVNAATLPPPPVPDDASLRALYARQKDRFVLPEQRLASHILVALPANATPAQQKAALARAEKIDALARAPGASFAKLAEQYSDDLGSKRQGGDLGWIRKGDTDKAFQSALFAMQKGEISAPVLSPEGYHIIDLRDIRAGRAKTFAEARPELLTQAEKDARDHAFSRVAGKLTDLIYQDPTSLDTAAKTLDLPIQTTPLFSRKGGAGIAANPKVIEAAFSSQVLKDRNTSDPINLGKDDVVVVHLAEFKPAAPQPLAVVSDQIRSDILAARADAAARAQARKLEAALAKGGDLTALAAEVGASVQSARDVGRNGGDPANAKLDPALLKQVFLMPQPMVGKPSVAQMDLGQGRYALVALDAVHPGDPAKLPTQLRQMYLDQLKQIYAQAAASGFIAALRQHTAVKIDTSRM
ncbi:MAG: SurA N-terminal domain-containing protein [Xanthomonadaceae bacterium]|nr:SurA N-terminal domain-containing protein [Xanthomonadaceae bacterium]MDE2178404.1 SurA N-terminal domain-containing protein [Xanthomonadaceae bacterium]MDE2244819.1 SurA N-terminal domain-containing protein [Xanthomonadaceae bacterium]